MAVPSPVGDLNSVPVSIGSITSAVQEIEPTISTVLNNFTLTLKKSAIFFLFVLAVT